MEDLLIKKIEHQLLI